jgi:adenylosuccinate lyase
MISRYEVPEISSLWSDENKFKNFLKVEIELLHALEAKGDIPKGKRSSIRKELKK